MSYNVKQMYNDIPTLMKQSRNKIVQLRMKENMTVRGILLDFDVYMNLALDDAEDISDTKAVKLGKTMLRGNNIFAISFPED